MISSAIENLRNHGGAAIRNTLVGENKMDPSTLASPDDHGLFGPDSITWKINADIAILVGGLRSLIYQTLHPLAMAGVAEHSDYQADPFGRLQRTSQFVGGTTFGNTAHAERLIKTVRRVHNRVQGVAPDGRPYSANDPRLLLWVHAVEVDSFLDSYKRYSLEPLQDWEADAYVAEMSVVARRLGATDLPLSVADLEATLDSFRPEMKAGAQAREAWKFLLSPPFPLITKAPYGIIAAAAITSLPEWILEDMKIPIPRGVEPLAVRPAAIALTKGPGLANERKQLGRDTGRSNGRRFIADFQERCDLKEHCDLKERCHLKNPLISRILEIVSSVYGRKVKRTGNGGIDLGVRS